MEYGTSSATAESLIELRVIVVLKCSCGYVQVVGAKSRYLLWGVIKKTQHSRIFGITLNGDISPFYLNNNNNIIT